MQFTEIFIKYHDNPEKVYQAVRRRYHDNSELRRQHHKEKNLKNRTSKITYQKSKY